MILAESGSVPLSFDTDPDSGFSQFLLNGSGSRFMEMKQHWLRY